MDLEKNSEKTKTVYNNKCTLISIIIYFILLILLILGILYTYSSVDCEITGYKYYLLNSDDKKYIIPYMIVKLPYDSPKSKNIIAYDKGDEKYVKNEGRGYVKPLECCLINGKNETEEEIHDCYECYASNEKEERRIGKKLKDCYNNVFYRYPSSGNICRFENRASEKYKHYSNGWCNDGFTDSNSIILLLLGIICITIVEIIILLGIYKCCENNNPNNPEEEPKVLRVGDTLYRICDNKEYNTNCY